MNIKKPNSFARYGSDYVAPLTTIDQIVKPSGERYTSREFELMSNVENVMFGENSAGKNLLNPTLQTTTSNGVTCTNNGDGTYTLNGTASNTCLFSTLGDIRKEFPSGQYRMVGSPIFTGVSLQMNDLSVWFIDDGNGVSFEKTAGWTLNVVYIKVDSGVVCNNLVFKPMLTEDLTATYDDFEPYVKSLRQLTDSALNMDLLWTNASPTSVFGGQTINLDLSRYKQIIIVFKLATDINLECSNFFNVSSNYSITPMYQSYGNSSGTIVAFREINYVFVDGVSIGNGKKVTSLGNYINNDNFMIPYQIYGVK